MNLFKNKSLKKLGCLCLLFGSFITLISCGKKVEDNKDEKIVSITPGIEVDETTNVENGDYSLSIDKGSFNHDDVILLTIKNTGTRALNHLAFEFFGAPSVVNVTRVNCFDIIEPGNSCHFAAVYNVVQSGAQSIKARYDDHGVDIELTVEFDILGENIDSNIHFLYQNIHTKNDCQATRVLQKNGEITIIDNEEFCSFRGVHYYETQEVEITQNPLDVFNNNSEVADEHYCPENWNLASFSFQDALVQEKTNFFGGEKDVIIPAGESREVCVKRGLFSCSEKKIFYSRLTKVHCY